MASKEVAKTETVEPSKYPVLAGTSEDGLDVSEILAENFGGDGISAFDLDRISVPAGGGTAWEIPTMEGTDSAKVLTGVIVAWTKPRVFWEEGLDDAEETGPPDCSSDDSVFGIGMYGVGSELHPSGECETCPMNQWGSGSSDGNARGRKACKETRLLFLLMEDGLLPVTVSLPPTSIGNLRKYMLRLASGRVPYYGVTTNLELEQVKGSGAIKYSVVKASMGQRLSPELRDAAREYGETFRKMNADRGARDVAADEYAKNAE